MIDLLGELQESDSEDRHGMDEVAVPIYKSLCKMELVLTYRLLEFVTSLIEDEGEEDTDDMLENIYSDEER